MSDQPRRVGRPSISPADRKDAHLKFRTRGDLQQRLAAEAAANNRSLSEEVEFRLMQSFVATDIRQIVREEIATALKVQTGLGLPEILEAYQSAAIPLRRYDHLPS